MAARSRLALAVVAPGISRAASAYFVTASTMDGCAMRLDLSVRIVRSRRPCQLGVDEKIQPIEEPFHEMLVGGADIIAQAITQLRASTGLVDISDLRIH